MLTALPLLREACEETPAPINSTQCHLSPHYVCWNRIVCDAVEAHCYVNIWTEVKYASKICNRKSKNPGHFDPEGLRQLMKTFEVKMSRAFTLPVAYFARINWLPFRIVYISSQNTICTKQCNNHCINGDKDLHGQTNLAIQQVTTNVYAA